MATNVWKLPSVKRTFILVEERRSRRYMTDKLGTVNDSYIKKVLDDGHAHLLGESTEQWETHEELE